VGSPVSVRLLFAALSAQRRRTLGCGRRALPRAAQPGLPR
jgi:hypothetical protein